MSLKVFLKKSWFLPLVIFVVALLFYTRNLDGQYYQLDEAGTVLQARGIAYFGYPAGWDGRNLNSDNNGREYNLAKHTYFWTWQPPLQSVIAFIGGKLFGETVFGYRLLFAVFGALTVWLFYLTASLLFKKRRIVLLVTLQLLLCLPFFLYVRQVRYYAPSAFFTVALVYLFIKAEQGKWGRREDFLTFLASLFLFLTNYFVWAGGVIPLGLFLLRQRRKASVIALIITGIVALAWFFILKPFAGNPTGAYQREVSLLTQFLKYFPYIHNYIFAFFWLPLFFFAKKLPKLFYLLVGFILFKFALDAIFLETHGRYLVDLIPILMLMFGFLYQALERRKLRWVVAAVLVSSLLIANLGTLFPKALLTKHLNLIWIPRAYAIELNGRYPNMLMPLASYLKDRAKPGDIFWTNNYRNQLYLASGVPQFTPVCDMKTETPLGPESVADRAHIRWFIFLQNDSRLPQNLNNEPCLGKVEQQKLEKDYKKVLFTTPDSYYLVNDPDIVNRSFPPGKAPSNEVIIYEKK